MRLRDAIAVAVLVGFVATACSRLTFVKPSGKRGDSVATGPSYSFKDPPEVKRANDVRNHLALSQDRLQTGAYAEAEHEAREALHVDPKSADAYTLLAIIAGAQNKTQDAGGFYAKAAALAPQQGTALNNYGAWLCGNGRSGESLTWFDRALADPAYAPQRASAMANAGACALKAGQTGRVENDLRGALALDPGNAVALGAMAELQFRSARYMDARAFSERRLAAAPADAATLRLASNIEDQLGDKAAAARYVQRLRTEFPPAGNTQSGEPITMMPPNHTLAESERGCGARLRSAREAAGLDIAEVASRLRMPVRIVEALEAEDFDRIGAPVFVRGQLRSYSRLLGLPTESVQTASGTAPIEPTRLVPRTRTPRTRRIADQIGGRLVYIVITALIVLPVWVATRSHLGVEDDAAPLDVPAGDVTVAQTPAAPVSAGPQRNEPSTVVASMASLPPRQPAEAAPNAPQIELHFAGDSWMQVIGPDGGMVEEALVHSGESRSYPAATIGRVVLGNASAVQVLHDGDVQDTTPFMRANVARFAVSSDGSIVPVSN